MGTPSPRRLPKGYKHNREPVAEQGASTAKMSWINYYRHFSKFSINASPSLVGV
jgi:hypothetical protein